MLAMIRLLLRRGASPEASQVPFPAVHHALLADDKPLLAALLAAGGDPNSRLPHQVSRETDRQHRSQPGTHSVLM